MTDGNTDRSVRNLAALHRTASTSRVLNLLAVASEHSTDPGYRAQPFFQNHVLNQALILKHRVRPNEQFDFEQPRYVATKVIIPFERSELDIGGQSFFIGQRGWITMVQELAGADSRIQRDLAVFQALEELPSLDPFILREHLNRRSFTIDPLYFSISAADLSRMQIFVGTQILPVIEMAFPNGSDTRSDRLAALLLSSQIDERLEPLRMVLRLTEDAYREGMFSWKGFLYYQWALADLDQRLAKMMKDLPLLQASGRRDGPEAAFVRESKIRIAKSIRECRREVSETIGVYQAAYRDLTQNNKPMAFRDFLLNAPAMFMVLGEKIGAISHIASFWSYRFEGAYELVAPMEEVIDILQDFESALTC